MDDHSSDRLTLARRFLEPANSTHRQYEALRALFVDDEPLERVAERFDYKPSTLRSMASRLRADYRRGVATPFFSPTAAGGPTARGRAKNGRAPRRPTSQTVAS